MILKTYMHNEPVMAAGGHALTRQGARLPLLQATCCIAECAAAVVPSAVCVAAILTDTMRFSVFGGRAGLSRSLGSVYTMFVIRFLGSRFRGVVVCKTMVHDVRSIANGVAVSLDGASLLVADTSNDGGINVIAVAELLTKKFIGAPETWWLSLLVHGAGTSTSPLGFNCLHQLWVASDGYVFAADAGNHRIQVLAPQRCFNHFVGVGHVTRPTGVCASEDIVVVAELAGRISVFERGSGALRCTFGTYGGGAGELNSPLAVCFTSTQSRLAVADCLNHRLSVFSVSGEFVKHVGINVLSWPQGVACSSYDELVVADTGNHRVVVFHPDGSVGRALSTTGRRHVFTGIALHGGRIFAQAHDSTCVLFE
jgi:DNA-binding beta-propeller fold protein YncE